jgi:tRNA A58 N-methylase Trm61
MRLAEISRLETWEQDQAHAVAMIEPHLVYGGTVFEFGVGVGRVMKPIAAIHTRTQFWGYDIDSEYLDFAKSDARKNEHYSDEWPAEIRSAYSVITFQHMSDDEVREVIARIYPARLRFQFAIGDIQMPLNYQRSPEEVEGWCQGVGYKVTVDLDEEFPTWRWITAR